MQFDFIFNLADRRGGLFCAWGQAPVGSPRTKVARLMLRTAFAPKLIELRSFHRDANRWFAIHSFAESTEHSAVRTSCKRVPCLSPSRAICPGGPVASGLRFQKNLDIRCARE